MERSSCPRRAWSLAHASALLMLLAACTPAEEPDPSARSAAEAFADAWERMDGDDMAARAVSEPGGTVDADALGELLETQRERALITEIDVEIVGPVSQPAELPEESDDADTGEAIAVPADYSITYSSDAADESFGFEGTFELAYDPAERAWRVRWEDDLLWPGVDGADGFRVDQRWPRRAAILDRRGAPLARGPAASRSYPHGALAGATVGHIEPLAREDAAAAQAGRVRGDLVGASGLEAGLEERLAGTPGTKLSVVDDRGRVLEKLGTTDPIPGRDMRTTLDIEVQRAAEGAYGGTVGGAVVIDPRSGELLAVVSSSPFNPANYVGVSDISPFNRALSGTYPPGSALKAVTAAAALDTGVVTPGTQLKGPPEFRGVRNFESGNYPSLDFATAVKNSVNTAFAQVALKLGAKRLTKYAEAFGFNTEPAMPLHAATSSFPLPEDEGDLMWGSVGQAQVLATPMQMASVAATIANGGVRIEPSILRSQPDVSTRVMSKKTARTLTELMENVVIGGTGQAARISGLRVAGKTGTAEVDVDGERKNHAWFICFAPAESPKVAVAVVSEYGGIGGQVAAPLAASILLRVLPLVR